MATFVSVRLTGDPRVIRLLLVKVFMATSLFQLDLLVLGVHGHVCFS